MLSQNARFMHFAVCILRFAFCAFCVLIAFCVFAFCVLMHFALLRFAFLHYPLQLILVKVLPLCPDALPS